MQKSVCHLPCIRLRWPCLLWSAIRELADTHYVSDIEYQQKQIDVSTSQQNVEDQRQGLLQLHTAMEAAKDDLDHLIVQGESRKAEMDRQLQVIRQQQDELAGKENFTLTSPGQYYTVRQF